MVVEDVNALGCHDARHAALSFFNSEQILLAVRAKDRYQCSRSVVPYFRMDSLAQLDYIWQLTVFGVRTIAESVE